MDKNDVCYKFIRYIYDDGGWTKKSVYEDVYKRQEYDSDHKLTKFQSICGTIRQALLKKRNKEIVSINIFKAMAEPVLLYGSEAWVPVKKHLSTM